MNQPLNLTAIILMLLTLSIIEPVTSSNKTSDIPVIKPVHNSPKIQVAILLDVSNSMDGLIEQAKAQLWNMVSVMGKVKCGNDVPDIEIALYEYGRTENDSKEGYVKQISSFTNDLDKLFRDLNGLTTHGGEEYCGHVIYNSLDQLNWDTSSTSYKVIFIAGNEEFLQGDIPYTNACTEAKKKVVIVNTIYCGNKENGIKEHWDLGAECGNGSFTNINQEAKPLNIRTPYDSVLIVWNEKLNRTFIAYGENANNSLDAMMGADTLPATDALDPGKVIKYIVVKSNKRLRNNSAWDLIDATDKDSSFINKIDMNILPDSLKKKSREELKQIVNIKAAERRLVQKQIADISTQRDAFYAAEKAKLTMTDHTLETEIERIIREQVKRFKMRVE